MATTETPETTFGALAIGDRFSFAPSRYEAADRHHYVKRSARGWTHPTYGDGRVGSIHAKVQRAYDAAIAYATERGRAAGVDAAGWYTQDAFGGRVTRGNEAAARRILRGIEDGDPAVVDGFPSADLSGEWADTLTGPELVSESLEAAAIETDGDEATDWFTEICDAYEAAFSTAAEDEITRAARLAID